MSSRRKLALFGRPISGPVSASTSSMVRPIFDHQASGIGAAEEAADAVGDEVGRVLAWHHAFAEAAVGEIVDVGRERRVGFGAGNQFQQVQIARRVEEVRAQKMLAELGREAFGDLASGMPLVLVERMAPGLRCFNTFSTARA